jgi:hypothetical protein
MLSPNQKIHSQTHNPKNKNKSCPSNTAKRRFNSSNATQKTKFPHSFVNSKRKKKIKTKGKNQNTSLSLSLSLSLHNLHISQPPTTKTKENTTTTTRKERKKKESLRTNIRCDDASDKTD